MNTQWKIKTNKSALLNLNTAQNKQFFSRIIFSIQAHKAKHGHTKNKQQKTPLSAEVLLGGSVEMLPASVKWSTVTRPKSCLMNISKAPTVRLKVLNKDNNT